MKKIKNESYSKGLRERAEEFINKNPSAIKKVQPDDVKKLIEDLQIHQVELEMQNEELRQAQLELEEARDKYSDLYDFAPVSYFTISDKGMILEANLTVATMLGVEKGLLIGKPFSYFINRDDQDIFYHHRKKLFETKAKQTCELRLRKKDGSQFYAHLGSTPVLDENGNLHQVRAAVTDITEHKRAEEALQEDSERLEGMVEEGAKELKDAQEQLIRREKLAVLGQLAGGVGHELRNPMTALKNAAYFLNMSLNEPEPQVKATLEILNKEVATSEKIISSLLDFARPKAPTVQKVDVNEIVEEALSRTTVPKDIEVVRELDDGLPAIQGDPDQLSQAFGNLILNAVQAMPEGGRLTVKSQLESPEQVVICVGDTGAGISEENLAKVFEPLFTTKARGIGLGLALTKTLVEGNGGTIEVKSGAGEGTTFTVGLPLAVGEANWHGREN